MTAGAIGGRMAGGMRPGALSLVVSCEHGGNDVPVRYRSLFDGANDVLQSHRGWDPGARSAAIRIARMLKAPLKVSTTSRLLVELNRSRHHRRLFSDFSSVLSPDERDHVLQVYWHPYRDDLECTVRERIAAGLTVVHLSVHSFTRALDGVIRPTDIGLLYDPGRRLERTVCDAWIGQLRQTLPAFVTHRNQPYRGTADGLTTFLRKRFPDAGYAGIELEVCNSLIWPDSLAAKKLVSAIGSGLRTVIAGDYAHQAIQR